MCQSLYATIAEQLSKLPAMCSFAAEESMVLALHTLTCPISSANAGLLETLLSLRSIFYGSIAERLHSVKLANLVWHEQFMLSQVCQLDRM